MVNIRFLKESRVKKESKKGTGNSSLFISTRTKFSLNIFSYSPIPTNSITSTSDAGGKNGQSSTYSRKT